MRSLALLLLLLNISFLTWQLSKLPWLPWQPEQFVSKTPMPQLSASNLPRLVLLHEHHSSNTTELENTNKFADTTTKFPSVSFPTDNNANISKTLVKTMTSITNNTSMTKETTSDSDVNRPKIPVETVTSITGNTPMTQKTTSFPKDTEIRNLLTETNMTRENQHLKTGEENTKAFREEEDLVSETHKKDTKTPVIALSKLQSETKSPMIFEEKSVVKNNSEQEIVRETVNQVSLQSVLVVKDVPKSLPKKVRKSFTCFQLGPYFQAEAAQKIANWLKRKKNVMLNIQDRQTQVLESTWIYLPPFESRQSAHHALQRLGRIGIKKDYEIVKSGKFKNAISLGLYRKPFYVKQRLDELSAKGYFNVKTQKRYKSDTRYWLNVKMSADRDELLNTFRKKIKESMLTSVACESIANVKIP